MGSLKYPCFVFNELAFLQELDSLLLACKTYWNNYVIGYSVKTNSFPPLLKYIKSKGVDVEVVSEDEFDLVSKIGYKSKRIICNGPIKDRSWIFKILDTNSILNIDSKRELKYVCEYAELNTEKNIEVGLRVNFDFESYYPGECVCGSSGSRFGFSVEENELYRAIDILSKVPNVRISGLHLHINTQTRRVEIYKLLVRKFAEIVSTFQLNDVKYLDIGGGFYGGISDKPKWNDYLSAIYEELIAFNYKPENLILVLEPGVSLIAGSFSYLTEVIDVKMTRRQRYVVLNGSRIHIDPLMHKSAYFYSIIKNEDRKGTSLKNVIDQELVGFTCLEKDRFFILKDEPPLQEGDIVQFDKVGAYTMTLSPLFISYFPPVYFRYANGDDECMRKKWTVNEFIQLSEI